MERRFQARLDELLGDADVPRSLLRGALPRRGAFLQPFLGALIAPQRANALDYVAGRLSDLQSKDAAPIASLHDRERPGRQTFIGPADGDPRPLIAARARPVGQGLGEPDGVLVFDPSAFPTCGTPSVGVARPWCGRLGKLDNCPVGVSLGYAARPGHALVDVRRYLGKDGAQDRKRMNKAGVPRGVRFATRHERALPRLDAPGGLLPHAWVAGDDERGRRAWSREALRARGARYLLAVPSHTRVRDLVAAEPPYGGHGRQPRAPLVRADRWRAAWPASAGQAGAVRDGAQGPRLVQAARARVQAKTAGKPSGVGASLGVFRPRPSDGTFQHDSLRSNAVLRDPVPPFARVHQAGHRVEECLKRAKGEAGLADYPVRTWAGGHHHPALSLVARGFRSEEARRGENPGARADGARGPGADRRPAQPGASGPPPGPDVPHRQPPAPAQRGGAELPRAAAQPMAASTL
jgi:hypothetical protein